jgi:hypothetical protein
MRVSSDVSTTTVHDVLSERTLNSRGASGEQVAICLRHSGQYGSEFLHSVQDLVPSSVLFTNLITKIYRRIFCLFCTGVKLGPSPYEDTDRECLRRNY